LGDKNILKLKNIIFTFIYRKTNWVKVARKASSWWTSV